MEIEKLIEQAKELDKRATPGPWKWDLRKTCRDAKIVTDHSGQYYVMGFARWGMQGAVPTFQVYDRYEGPVTERGSHGMKRADELARSYPGKEHHRGFDDYPDHPDARFIVEARRLLPELIAAVEHLSAELTHTHAQLDSIIKKYGLYHDGRGDAILNLLAMSQEGRLLVLPCEIGETVYRVYADDCGGTPCSDLCERCPQANWKILPCKFGAAYAEDYGKTVFKDEETARSALEKIKTHARACAEQEA
jgi:hypothetical protein